MMKPAYTKLIRQIFVGAALGCLVSSFAWARAEEERGVSSDYMVEYSLSGLKDSAQQMLDRNNWLSEHIRELQNQNLILQQQLAILEEKKNKLVFFAKNEKDVGLPFVEGDNQDGSLHFMKDLVQWQQEEKNLNDKISQKQNEIDKIKESAKQEEADVKRLEYELNLVDKDLKDPKQQQEWEELLSARRRVEKSLANAHRTLEGLETKATKPQQTLHELEIEQQKLKEKIGQMENNINVSLNEENDIKQDIFKIRNAHAQRINQLNSNVEALQVKINEFTATLSQAQAKLSTKVADLSSPQDDQTTKRNLDTIKQENLALKEEILTLKETLDKLEK